MELFDAKQSDLLKQQGMDLAVQNRADLLHIARQIAVEIGQQSQYVTADDVGRRLKSMGIDSIGPAAGSIFKTDDWEFTGRYKKSARVSNHSRMLRVWRYVK